jgi:hypothetical protein
MEMFRKIIEKAKDEGAYQVGLFNWVEPFLEKKISDFASVVKEFSIRCEIASTLSVKRINRLVECLGFVDKLWVTVSGYTQSIYEINHAAGHVRSVIAHLETISQAKASGKISTDVLVRYLMWDYNAHEVQLFRNLAERLGFRYEVLLGTGHPINMRAPKNKGDTVSAALAGFSAARIYEPAGYVCPLLFEHIAVNAAGDVYQCSAYGNYATMRIGQYLDLSREEILLRRYAHPFCNSCNWTRRLATEHEKSLLLQAMEVRMGRQIVRVGPLSGPLKGLARTAEGYLLPKDGHVPKGW